MRRVIICYDEGLQEQAENLKPKLFDETETEDNWIKLSEIRKCQSGKQPRQFAHEDILVRSGVPKKSIYEATMVVYLQKTDVFPEGFCSRLIKYDPFPNQEIEFDAEFEKTFKEQEKGLKEDIEKLCQHWAAKKNGDDTITKMDIPCELFEMVSDEYLPTADQIEIIKAAASVIDLYKSVKTSGGIISEETFDKEQLDSMFNRDGFTIDKDGGIVTPASGRVNHISKVTIFRCIYTRLYGFVALTDRFVDELAKFLKGKSVLSVMSGSCTLEKHLISRGINVVCSDTNEWAELEDKYYQRWKCRCPNMLKLDAAEAIRCCGKKVDFVLMSWPPYATPAAKKTLEAMREVNPDLIMIYVGEDAGGNCANDEFFDIARDIEDKTFAPVQNAFRSFVGMHDYIRLME